MFDKHAKSYAEQQLRMRNVRQRRALKFATRIHAYIVSVYVCRVSLGVRINNHIHIKIAFGLLNRDRICHNMHCYLSKSNKEIISYWLD